MIVLYFFNGILLEIFLQSWLDFLTLIIQLLLIFFRKRIIGFNHYSWLVLLLVWEYQSFIYQKFFIILIFIINCFCLIFLLVSKTGPGLSAKSCHVSHLHRWFGILLLEIGFKFLGVMLVGCLRFLWFYFINFFLFIFWNNALRITFFHWNSFWLIIFSFFSDLFRIIFCLFGH